MPTILPRRYPEMEGKVALVTGGTSGIGLATAQVFAHEGAIVVIAGRDEKRAKSALDTIEGQASWIGCDVADGKRVAKLIASILERHGRLDYAFNNGSNGGADRPVGKMSEDAWRKTIDGFLTSTFLCMRHQIPAMLANGAGVIVNNSSVDGLRGYPFSRAVPPMRPPSMAFLALPAPPHSNMPRPACASRPSARAGSRRRLSRDL
jgi:NAD(P)-dependent dehydrogenase (short-subunit alcohol dehydrogenase family)